MDKKNNKKYLQNKIKKLEHKNKALENINFTWRFICLALFLVLIISTISSSYKSNELGQMICSEKGNYVFDYYDSKTQTLICKEVNIQKYDGGYIKIER